jgi:NIPSNAP
MRLDRRTLLAVVAASPLLAARLHARETDMPQNDIVELRQYTLHGGKRDALIELFEREFVEPQNVLGARVLGTFRDLDDPDRFVWLRSFDSMEARAEALTAFYDGPVWRTHRAAANATMIDSDNVLLLRRVGNAGAPAPSAGPAGILTAHIHYLGLTTPARFAEVFDRALRPRLADFGVTPFATFATETAANSFLRLPVREGEPVFVWLARWPDERAVAAFEASFAGLSGWRDAVPAAALPALMRKPERLRLAPTETSALR